MNTRTITGLKTNEFRILKHIHIVKELKSYPTTIGNIFYKREFGPDYKITNDKNSDENENFLYQYTKHENFPDDKVDEIILNSIQEFYPNSFVRNNLIVYNVDLEMLQVLKNKNKIGVKAILIPIIDSHIKFAERSFKVPEIDLNIYTDDTTEFVENLIFIMRYPIDDTDTLSQFSYVEFE